jgi:hypothetical protein
MKTRLLVSIIVGGVFALIFWAFLLNSLQSSVQLYYECASVSVYRLSDYDLNRKQERSEKPLQFLEFTDDDLKEIPAVKRMIEAIGDRVEYNDSSHIDAATEEAESYREFLSDKFEQQFGYEPDFYEHGDSYILYNDKTYWVNTGGYSTEYFPTKTLVVEESKFPQKESIIITDEDLVVLPKVKEGIEKLWTYEISSYNYTGIPENEWNQYRDYFEKKSTERFGDESGYTTMFHYDGRYYQVGFAIC